MLGLVEVRAWVVGEVGFEEFGGVREGDAEVEVALELETEVLAAAVEDVAAGGAVGGEDVEVVAGDRQRLRVGR